MRNPPLFPLRHGSFDRGSCRGAVPAATVPVPMSKRFACQTASQGLNGQDRQDQMQLCMAQARMDCLKQAIDQKIVGPKRKDFIKACTE